MVANHTIFLNFGYHLEQKTVFKKGMFVYSFWKLFFFTKNKENGRNKDNKFSNKPKKFLLSCGIRYALKTFQFKMF